MTTLAGTGVPGSNYGPASSAQFNQPKGIAVDSAGNVYVTDSANSTVRLITPGGVVSTPVGTAGVAGSADGSGTFAQFSQPAGLAVDLSGNLYVADAFNNAIRQIQPGLADAAAIDQSVGSVGALRQLHRSAQLATSFQWSLIRRPSPSSAQLSSATSATPTFYAWMFPDSFIFQLVATSTAGVSITQVSLNASTPAITSVLTATGMVGQSFTYTITASNNPSSFSASGLPAWAGVNTTTGLISGTPPAVATSSVQISATNAAGPGAQATLTITIVPAGEPVITSPLTAIGLAGLSFTYTITALNNPTSFAAAPLPPGLSVNTSTGIISGTPTTVATTGVLISATNGIGTGAGTLFATIHPGAPLLPAA